MSLLKTVVKHLELKKLPDTVMHNEQYQGLSVSPIAINEYELYRHLYREVGALWHWMSRKNISAQEYLELFKNPNVLIYVLRIYDEPIGFSEFLISFPTIKLIYFGVLPGCIGKGYGKYFLDATIRSVWLLNPEKIILTTRDSDHKNARYCYLNYGFVETDTTIENIKINY